MNVGGRGILVYIEGSESGFIVVLWVDFDVFFI